jgi:hypothetical protein
LHWKTLTFIVISTAIGLCAILSTTSPPILNTQQAYAAANCDKAILEHNDQGKLRGNPKLCVDDDADGEQPRSSNSKNKDKDNDGGSILMLYTKMTNTILFFDGLTKLCISNASRLRYNFSCNRNEHSHSNRCCFTTVAHLNDFPIHAKSDKLIFLIYIQYCI